jgi:molybdate transport system permease protein
VDSAYPIDWRPLWLSLEVAVAATIVSVAVGTLLGYGLARLNGNLRRWLSALVLLPLALPPTVLGWFLLVSLGRRSFIGQAWERLTGEPLVFTLKAAVIAACASAIPIVARQLAAAFAAADKDVLEAARLDGAHGIPFLLHVQLPMVRLPLVAAAAIAFARALGDFGATLMVAGNMPGRTQTAALAIYDMVNAGRDSEAMVLVAATTLLCLVVLLTAAALQPEPDRAARP